MERVLAHAPAGSCSVFAEFGYDDQAGLEATIERVLAHVAAVGGDEAAGLAGTDDQVLRDIRTFRHAVPERINATIARRREQHPALHKVATDMAVEDSDLRWVYDLYSSRLTASGLDHAIFGHVGNNHFHVNILPKDEAELQRAKDIYAEFARRSSPAADASRPNTASGASRSRSWRCNTTPQRSTPCEPRSGGSIRSGG